MNELKVKLLNEKAIIPTRNHPFDAGLDIYALENTFIPYGQTAKVSTGISVQIEPGYYGQVNDRSGMAVKGLRVGAGVVDCGYIGELSIVLHNLNNKQNNDIGVLGYQIKAGDRIAQLVIYPISLPKVVEVKNLEETERGSKGFNSSGR